MSERVATLSLSVRVVAPLLRWLDPDHQSAGGSYLGCREPGFGCGVHAFCRRLVGRNRPA